MMLELLMPDSASLCVKIAVPPTKTKVGTMYSLASELSLAAFEACSVGLHIGGSRILYLIATQFNIIESAHCL